MRLNFRVILKLFCFDNPIALVWYLLRDVVRKYWYFLLLYMLPYNIVDKSLIFLLLLKLLHATLKFLSQRNFNLIPNSLNEINWYIIIVFNDWDRRFPCNFIRPWIHFPCQSIVLKHMQQIDYNLSKYQSRYSSKPFVLNLIQKDHCIE